MSPEDTQEQARPRVFPLYLLGFAAGGLLIGIVGTVLLPPLHAKSPGDVTPQATGERLTAVAKVEFVQATPAHPLKTGDAVYAGLCSACHGTGVMGAPKVGDKTAWGPRITQGFDTLVKHATDGFKAMPPKGGGADLDAQEVARAVAWMANQSGAAFTAP